MKLYCELVFWLTIRPRMVRLQKLLPMASIHPTGSRYVCDPPVIGTDIDFLVYSVERLDEHLMNAGYVKSPFTEYFNQGNQVDDFDGWRKGAINLIVTTKRKYAETFQTATHICKTRNVRCKNDRVAIHECIRGNYVEWTFDDNAELRHFMDQFRGPHSYALQKAYRAKHEIEL